MSVSALPLRWNTLACAVLVMAGGCRPAAVTPPVPATREELAGLRQTVMDARVAVERGEGAAKLAEFTRVDTRDPRKADAARLGAAVIRRFTYAVPAAVGGLTQLREHGTEAARLYAMLSLGELATARFDSTGLPLMKEAWRKAAALHDSASMAEALLYRGRLELRLGTVDSTYAVYDRAYAVLPQRDTTLRALIRCSQGFAERLRNPTLALKQISDGMALAVRAPLRRVAGFCYLARAQTSHFTGQQWLAAAQVDSGIRVLRAARDADVEAGAWQLLGYLHADFLGPLELGTQAAESAAVIGARCGNRLAAGWAHLTLTRIFARLGDTERAWRESVLAEQQLGAIGDRLGLANVTLARGEAAYAEYRLPVAESLFVTLEKQYRANANAAFLPLAWMRLAALARTRGDVPRADSLLNLVHESAVKLGHTGWDTDRVYELALTRMVAGQWDEAAKLLATFEKESEGYPDMLFAAASRRAEVAAAAGREDEALRQLDRAAAILERRRSAMADRTERLVAMSGQRMDFDADFGLPVLVERLARNGRTDAALRAAEVHRAREALTRDEASLAALGRERATLTSASGRYDGRGLRALVPEHAAALEYVIGDAGEPSVLLVVRRDTVIAVPLTIPADLADQVSRFTTTLAADAPASALARSLGSVLMAGALPYLPTDVEDLYVVPDGALHRLPFEALILPDGRRVLERFVVGMLPTLRLLTRPGRTPAARGTAARVIAFGDPVFRTTLDLPPLPASRAEAESVARSDAGGVVRLGGDASESALKALRGQHATILHFATHATVVDAGLNSSVLHLSAGAGEDGDVTVSEIARLELSPDLVVLSACRTAGGAILRGEGLQGISAPFLQAGARNVLATRWTVRDKELLPLMSDLYARLSKGQRVAAAVRDAQLAAFRRGEGPRQWASLMLVGDGRAVPLPAATVSAAR